MSEPGTPENPNLRYLILASLIAIVGTVIVVVLYGNKVLPIAGPFVLLALLPLLLPLRARGLAKRRQRMAAKAADELTAVRAAVDEERRTPEGGRSSGATDQSLAHATSLISSAQEQFNRGTDLPAMDTVRQLDTLAREWNPKSSLFKTVAKLRGPVRVHAAMIRQLGG